MDDAKMPEAWRVFRIQAELVDGIEHLIKIGDAVSVYGSARLAPDNYYYKEAQRLGGLLTEQGLAVITGGGPGIMEGANRGAYALRTDRFPPRRGASGAPIFAGKTHDAAEDPAASHLATSSPP